MNLENDFVLREEEVTAFDVYFASIASMQFHPGAGTKEHARLDITECREVAIKMIRERRLLCLGQ